MDINSKMRAAVEAFEIQHGRRPRAVVLSSSDYDQLEEETRKRSPGRPPCTNCVYHIAGVIVEEGEVTHLEP